MRQFFKASTAIGLALALLGAPLAMAQPQDNHGNVHNTQPHEQPGHEAPKPSPHVTPLPTHPEMSAPMHTPMSPAMPMAAPHVTNHNVHETVNVHENTHVTQMAPHGAPAHSYFLHGHPMPHVAFSGHYWHHGGHFYGHRYVVNNWQYYGLTPPPAGYEWVQDGDQFVLVAIASGIIASVIVGALTQ